MASLYPRGNLHWARIKNAAGEWTGKSTGVKIKGDKERKTAQKVAEEMERFALELNGITPSEAHLAKFAREAARRINPEQFNDKTIREFFTEWLETNEEAYALGKISKATLAYYSGNVNAFLEWMGSLSEKPYRTLNTAKISEFRDSLLKSGHGATTVSKYLKSLSVPLNDAWKKGSLELNPVKSVKLPTLKPNKRKIFTNVDITKMINILEGEWLNLFLIGLYTGARLGDCVRMRWEDVDIFNGTLEFTQQKTERKNPEPIIIPLHPYLWGHLKCIRKKTGFITPALAAKVGASEKEDDDENEQSGVLSTEFGKLMESAGVSQETIKLKSGRGFSHKSFHSLRHTINTALSRQAKVGQEVRSRLTGHKLKGMNQHYTHTEIEEVRDALSKISFAV